MLQREVGELWLGRENSIKGMKKARSRWERRTLGVMHTYRKVRTGSSYTVHLCPPHTHRKTRTSGELARESVTIAYNGF